jgi:hypothetical protein
LVDAALLLRSHDTVVAELHEVVAHPAVLWSTLRKADGVAEPPKFRPEIVRTADPERTELAVAPKLATGASNVNSAGLVPLTAFISTRALAFDHSPAAKLHATVVDDDHVVLVQASLPATEAVAVLSSR